MGAATYVRDRLTSLFGGDFNVSRVSRAASGSPATGSHAIHELEHADLLRRALARSASRRVRVDSGGSLRFGAMRTWSRSCRWFTFLGSPQGCLTWFPTCQ